MVFYPEIPRENPAGYNGMPAHNSGHLFMHNACISFIAFIKTNFRYHNVGEIYIPQLIKHA